MSGFFRDSLIIGSNSADKDTLLGNSIFSNFIATFDLEGKHIWSKKFLGTSNLTRFWRIGISQNGYYFGGYYQNNLYFDIDTITSYTAGNYDAFLYKTDLNGNGEWIRRIRGQSTENFRTIATDEFDNVYVLGNYNSPSIFVDSTETQILTFTGNSGGYDTYIGKYNRSGILQWLLRKGSSAKDVYLNFVIRNNLIYATGYFANQIIFNEDTLRSSSSLNEDAFLAAFNEIGDPIAGVSVQGTGDYNDAGTVVNMGTNSRAYVAGYYKSPQIQIGDSIYTSNNENKSDLFFAIYEHPFKAVITDERYVTCHGLSNGMLTVTPYFGRPPYTYSWSHDPGLNNPVAEGLAANSYTVTITDGRDSTAIITGTVYQPDPLLINGTPTNPTCYNDDNGKIDVSPTGGTTPYIYNWTSEDGSGLNPTGQNQSGLNRGTYVLTLRDQNLCTEIDTFVLTEPDPFIFAGSVATENTGGDTIPNGTIDLNVTGGTQPYYYRWTFPLGDTANTEDLDSLIGGDYAINVKDINGCEGDTSLVVYDETVLIAQIISKSDVSCNDANDGKAKVKVYNGIAPFDYEWSDGIGNSYGNASDEYERTAMAPLDYTVTVTDSDAPPKSATAKVKINEPAVLSLLLNVTNLRCKQDNSGVVSLQVSGGTLPYEYSWIGPDGFTATTEDLVNVASGNYAVTVTDANNCTQTAPPVFVNEPEEFLYVEVDITKEIQCFGQLSGQMTANVSGGTTPYKYLWSDPGAQVTKIATGLGAGNYKVTVTDNNFCIAVSDPVPLTQPAEITLTTVTYTTPSCFGASDGKIDPVFSFETPIDVYSWNTGWNERTISNIPADDYTLTVTDRNSCTKVENFTLTQPDPITIQSVDLTDPACFGYNDGIISIAATGGTGDLSYSVDAGVHTQSDPDFDTLLAGNYVIRVTDINDCHSADSSVTLNQPEGVTITSETAEDVTCYGGNDGSITIVASGGAGGLEFSIDNGLSYFANNGIFDNLEADSYAVRIKDAENCEFPGSMLTVNEPQVISVTIQVYENVSCNGSGDGSITLTATGGTGNLVYSINDGVEYLDNEGNFTGLDGGVYYIRVRDENNCDTGDIEITIIDPDPLIIDTTSVIHLTAGADGSITLQAAGGTGTVTFIARPLAADSLTNFTGLFSDLQAGDYLLYAIDDNQCISNAINVLLLEETVTGIIIYDAFSPNGDTKNDVWNIGNISRYPDCKIKIINSWGNKVFSSDGYHEPWDGTYNGNDLPSGTYYYFIDLGDGSDPLTGSVNIVK
ncbi:MAG: gliding motility-associated C-terminal domain-containing protein [Bacteroidales bacterium]|nr:gliding motility-associated C-terminal domain-containing protein [Bacteroidales bacterium]